MKWYIQYGLVALLIAVALGFAFRRELFFLVITPAKASAEAHSGAIAFIRDRDKPVGPLLTHLISARCEGGYLMISNPGKGFQKLVFPPGNYHFYDYNLFYMNLRENAVARTDAWLQHSQATVN